MCKMCTTHHSPDLIPFLYSHNIYYTFKKHIIKHIIGDLLKSTVTKHITLTQSRIGSLQVVYFRANVSPFMHYVIAIIF